MISGGGLPPTVYTVGLTFIARDFRVYANMSRMTQVKFQGMYVSLATFVKKQAGTELSTKTIPLPWATVQPNSGHRHKVKSLGIKWQPLRSLTHGSANV